ncbi:hypothetical protein [Kitasatospora griseola]|uniref:hypothetical protein n=1 Tax=Kitasatospora griseola TaxID=2064 RepID=UPI0036511764
MTITITARHLRALLNSPAERAVLYLATSNEPTLDVWTGGRVGHHHAIITRTELIDWLGDDWTDDEITEYLPELQDTIDDLLADDDDEAPDVEV